MFEDNMNGNLFNRLLTALLLSLALGACGDNAVHSNTDIDREDGDPSISDEYFMTPASSANIQANLTESVPLQVFLYSKKSGDAVDGQSISFEIVDGGEEASLSALQSTTSEEGKGGVDLRVGNASTTLSVRASHPSANDVIFAVEVLPLDVGDLVITPVNTAASIMPLTNIDIRIYLDSEMTCDEFRPFFEQVEPMAMETAPREGEAVSFADLNSSHNYIITGIARGDRDQIAAGGCLDDIAIRGDDNEEDLLLQLIPLNPVGRYEVTSNWDFTDAIADSGTVGATIVRILNIFENPGQAIYDEIINLVSNLVGGIISGAIDTFLSLTGLDDDFADFINGLIAGNSVLSQIFQAGADLRDVIANLEVTSELTIGKFTSDYEFRGSDNWLGVTLYWRWNCDANSPPDCGAIPLVADANGEIGSLGLLSSEWTGRIVAYNQLQIDTHTVSLRYGRLVIYILNEVILPAVTGGNANSLSEAFAYWIGCPSLATSITGSDGELCALGACVTDDQIEGFCTGAVTTIFGFADALISGLEFDIGLHLGGEGMLVETTSDGRVDLIENGEFSGYMQSSDQGAATSPFTATWTAVNLDNNDAEVDQD